MNFRFPVGPSSLQAAAAGGWEPRDWLTSPNRFSATLADTFLSRRAYLHGRAAIGGESTATMRFTVPPGQGGTYTVLLRYEAAYRCSPVDVKVILTPPCIFH